jgi:Flp pilus assembly protein TadB
VASAFVNILVRSNPGLRRRVRMARIGMSVEAFVARNIKISTVAAGCFSLLLFMLLDKMRGRDLLGQNFLLVILFFTILWFMSYQFFMNTVEVFIKRQKNNLNRDVLFVGRYLLIKLQSGVPFYQALIDASNGGFGTASRFVREIVDDIELGTPIEQALSNAADNSPSAEFRQILWQINAALRSGVDVTQTLKGILGEIASQQIIEVERYGKKLSTLSLLYMLGAVIIPSLGLTLFVSFSGFLGLSIQFGHLIIVVFILMFLQFMFLSLFRSIRPNINL